MEFAVGNRVGARGLAWDVVEVEQLGAQRCCACAAPPAICAGCNGTCCIRPNVLRSCVLISGSDALGRWLRGACIITPACSNRCSRPTTCWLRSRGAFRSSPYQLVPLMRALELPRASTAARRWRRPWQDDRGGTYRVRTDRPATCTSRAGRVARRPAARAVGPRTAASLRPAIRAGHRRRFVAGAAAQTGAGWQSVRCDRALPHVARFCQAGTRAGGA